MILAQLGTIVMLNLAGMFTPGPDVFLIMRVAARSRKHALFAALGITTGILVWASLTVLGTAALFATHPAMLGVVQLLGGMWLLWMGRSLIRSGLKERLSRNRLSDVPVEQQVGTLGHNYRLGLATNLSNPKAILFFASIMSPFIPVGAPWQLSAMVVGAILLTTVLGFSFLAYVVSASVFRRRLVTSGPWIDIVAGTLFSLVGVWMLVEGVMAAYHFAAAHF